MKIKTLITLILIIAIAAILRLWALGQVPPSPDWDEASLGYNAYSILHTGKDEYGKFLPFVFRSFDDYKPALYAYLIVPFISLFDLNIVVVRLPSALLGILSVIATFFLVKELFKKDILALFSSFLLAISPWHIQFSRIAFESNVGLALNIVWVLLFLKGLKRYWLLIPAAFIAGLNVYVYQSDKVFTPLLVLAAILIYRKQFFSVPKKYLLTALVIGAIVVLPMIFYTLTDKNALARQKGVSIFNSDTTNLTESSKKILIDQQNNDLIGLVFDNRRVQFARSIIFGYISHFDFNWLFIKGDEARHHAPGVGLMYLWELPFLLVGLYAFIFGDLDKKSKLLILAWFLITPIPASVTGGVPHSVRTLNFLPTFQLFTAFGVLAFLNFFQKWKFKKIWISILITIILANFAYYLNQYFVQQNYYNSKDWQYGYKEAVSFVEKNQNDYDKIIVSNKAPLDQSYMFFLFYLKYPPSLYQSEATYASGGFRENHQFGKYYFQPIDLEANKGEKVLYIGRANDFPSGAPAIYSISYLNGEKAIEIINRQ